MSTRKSITPNRETLDENAVNLAYLAIAFEQAHAVYFPASATEMAELASVYLLSNGVDYWISPGGDSITCTKCRHTSHNRNDVENRYCGFCHKFLEDGFHREQRAKRICQVHDVGVCDGSGPVCVPFA
jgi:hypothetical protein